MKRTASAALAVAAALIALAVPRLDSEPPAAAAENPAPAPAPPADQRPGVPVTAGTVAASDVPVFVNAIGTVQAFNMVTIKSRVDGQIVKLEYTEGQDVKAGTPLIQIDPRPYQATVDQALAAKQKDEAALASAEADLNRSAALVGSGYRAVQTYDQQKAAVGQLQASIKADEAQIQAARLNLSYTEIRAPIDGRLGARLVDIGNMVRSTDGTALVTVTQLKPIFVTFTVAQDKLDRIRDEQRKAPLSVVAFGPEAKEKLAAGRLTMIDNAIDQATGTIRLKATFDNADERLWPGEFVNLRLVLSTRKGVPTVPSQTVQDGPNGSYVYIIKGDDTVERREVKVGAVQDGLAVIDKGLSPGERVVVEGQHRLTNGARVKIASAAQAAR